MDRSLSRRGVAFLFAVWIAATAGAGGAVTHGVLSDTGSATGTMTVASDFEDTGPEGETAYVDENGNGRYDEGEGTYSGDDLQEFDDESADLVIPSDIDAVHGQNDDVDISAASITSETDITAQNGDVELEATDGDVDLAGSTVSSQNGNVEIATAGDVTLEGASIASRNDDVEVSTGGELTLDDATIETNGDVELTARSISATSASVESKNNGVVLSATENGGGELDATGAEIRARNDDIRLFSVGDMLLDSASLYSQNGAVEVSLGTTDATLSVEGTTIDDTDDTLVYAPEGITVEPDTDSTSS